MFYQDLFIISMGILLLVVAITLGSVNYFVHRRNEIQKQWESISELLSIRHDLLPSVLIIAQKYINIEDNGEIINRIILQRNKLERSSHDDKSSRAQEESELYKDILMLIEKMRNHKEAPKEILFHEIIQRLDQINKKIEDETTTFNTASKRYNQVLHIFPFSAIAYLGKFRQLSLFNIL